MEMNTDNLETLKYSALLGHSITVAFTSICCLAQGARQENIKCQPLAANQTKPRPVEISWKRKAFWNSLEMYPN